MADGGARRWRLGAAPGATAPPAEGGVGDDPIDRPQSDPGTGRGWLVQGRGASVEIGGLHAVRQVIPDSRDSKTS